MNNSAVGDFMQQICAFCGDKIARSDALYPGMVHRLDFGAVCHHSCWLERYRGADPFTQPSHSPVQGQLDLFGTPDGTEGSVACPVANLETCAVSVDGVREYLWYRNDTKAPMAEKIAAAVERYVYKFGQAANVVYVSEADWRRSGLQPGDEVVPGVRLFVSGYVHEFECKVGKE